MPITVSKQFKGGKFPSAGKARYVSYEIYTLAEAHDRNIEPVENWRDKIFLNQEDLTGRYVLTDDDPPLVTPIVGIRIDKGIDKRGRQIGKVHFPWTWTSSRIAKIRFGEKAFVHVSSVRKKFKNTNPTAFRLFFLLLAIGADPKTIIGCIWPVKHELEQAFLLKLIMTSEKAERAMSDLAKDVFTSIGASPDKVAKAMWKLATNLKISAKDRLAALTTIADRMKLDDREEESSSNHRLYGVGIVGGLGPPVEQGQLDAPMQEELERLARENGNTKVKALIKSQGQGEEVSSE